MCGIAGIFALGEDLSPEDRRVVADQGAVHRRGGDGCWWYFVDLERAGGIDGGGKTASRYSSAKER